MPNSLRVRTKLRERRPLAVRRHSARVTIRFLTLLSSDLFALILVKGEFRGLVESRFPSFGAVGELVARAGVHPVVTLYFVVAQIFWLHFTGSYSRHRKLNNTARILSACALAAPVLGWPLLRASQWRMFLSEYVLVVLLTWATVLFVRFFAEKFLISVWGSRGAAPALIIDHANGATPAAQAVVAPGGDYSLAGYVTPGAADDSVGMIRDLPHLIDKYSVEAVVLAAEMSPEAVAWILEESLACGCQLLYPARAVNIRNVRPRLVWHRDQPFFELGAPVLKAQALIAKRVVDLIGSLICIVVAFPLLIAIAIVVKLDSPGPIFFLQDRAGLGGQKFRLIKFRTMTDGADEKKADLAHLNHTGDPRLFKIPHDPRVTKLGSFLRRWSLDELPQLFNVFIGQMSLVGPRPFFEADFPSYEDHHFRRLDAKPGITGLWQVSGRSEILDFEDVVYLDRQYIEQWSFWLDVSILFRTLPAILRRTGAY